MANRGEIAIRVFRACNELGIRTVGIYTEEDKNALFRTKADESYLIGKGKGAIEAYLDINDIITLALKKGVDAIHPGYGFLSENAEFAKKCQEAGIKFIGPTPLMLDQLGDKVKSKIVAEKAGVPVVPGLEKTAGNDQEALEFARHCGYPVMLKAAAGGGGRGMRIVREEKDLLRDFHSARNEAKKAFGSDAVFIEKYIENPKHIEVQVLGDEHGNLIHVFERDCSVQRRHQKIIEITPALNITDKQRQAICSDAIKIAKAVNYQNAGTVEFLVDNKGNHFFIEMNPRIQVEHTITEMTTGLDLVQAQIRIAQGYKLNSKEINIKSQDDIKPRGFSIQCRVTTEDPMNNFAPDTGKIDVYRTSSGFGIRLDGGSGFSGSYISPYYDSLLLKTTSWALSFEDAIRKAKRALKEMIVSGVKTNVDFLLNVLNHPTFIKGECNTNFIAEHPELFDIRPREDNELKLLKYIGEKVVNETKGIKPEFDMPVIPKVERTPGLSGTKQILDKQGPDGLVKWIKSQSKLLMTDTSFRDAHQSLLATRFRTRDMEKIAPAVSELVPELFSIEMWGGATYDVAYRFLKESPWDRMRSLREKIPNVLFQMLLRASNAVGYKNYPDNVVREFIQESAKQGMDIFRIFDSLNWLEGMKVAMEEVLKTGKICEAAICYTGDILDKTREKYNLDYYLTMARELEKMGAHILAVKDMAGLLKPHAARILIKALKDEIKIPIHLHTHDTSGNQVATLLMASEAGVDIVDGAFSGMSGFTSQPSLNSVVAALKHSERDTGIDLEKIQHISDYFCSVRPYYVQFESDLKSSSTDVYRYEIPGGQYSNLKPQVESFGLGHRFNDVKEMYRTVNFMFGDIVKVTPSSKVVGDMAIFMVQNDLTPENIYEKAQNMAFPDSVVSYFQGMMGQPLGGFPEKLQFLVLKDIKPITCRPGELLKDENFDQISSYLKETHEIEPEKEDILTYTLYPKVFEDYLKYRKENGNVSSIDSDVYFYGLREGETCDIEIEEGTILIVKLIKIGKLDKQGNRSIEFEVNGNRREIKVKDMDKASSKSQISLKAMADPSNIREIGANIPGMIIKVLVDDGDTVEENQIVAVIEAMKMETNIFAPVTGKVESVFVKQGDRVESGELLIKLQEEGKAKQEEPIVN